MITKKATLEERILSIRKEASSFLTKYVEDQKTPGLPAVVVERMLMAKAGGDILQAALDVIKTIRRDEEIAQREWQKEHAARQRQSA